LDQDLRIKPKKEKKEGKKTNFPIRISIQYIFENPARPQPAPIVPGLEEVISGGEWKIKGINE